VALRACVLCLLLASAPACSYSSGAAVPADNQAAAYLDAVPKIDTLPRAASATQHIDPAAPAVDGLGQPLKSSGVTIGNPTTATAGAMRLEWVIYAAGGFSAADPPAELLLDLTGSSGTVWAGTTDYGSGTWHWQALAAPFGANMRLAIPDPEQAFKPGDGQMFIVLAVWDGGGLSFHGADAVSSAIPTGSINAFHRSGQTFITWPEREDLAGERYRIYRSAAPIVDAPSLAAAQKIYEVAEGSGNFYADRYNVDGSGNWQARYISRYVVNDLGAELTPGLGLLVWTMQAADFSAGTAGTAYYAVTVVPDGGTEDPSGIGGNLSSGPVSESVADPMPVEVLRGLDSRGHVLLQYMDLRAWNPTFHAPNASNGYYGLDDGNPAVKGSIQYAYCYTVGEPYSMADPPGKTYPVLLNLHGHNSNCYPPDTEGSWNYDTIEIRPIDVSETWYFGFAKHHDYRQSSVVEAGDTICNYTEYRILRMILDLLHDPVLGPHCDPNRIFVYGHSMGGSGTLAFALRYPTLFAAAYASEPMTNYLTDPLWEGDVTFKFGSRALNLPIELSYPGGLVPPLEGADGTGVYDWQNHEANAVDRLGAESVPLGIAHGRLDEAICWPQEGRGVYAALNAGKRCWGGYVDDRDHQWMSYLGCPPSFDPDESLVPFSGLRMILNETVPGLSNCSRDGSLPPLGPPAAPEQYNAVIDWSSSWDPWDGAPYEDFSMWRMSLRTTDGQPATVDVTPRRTQTFKPWPDGVPYTWTNRKVSDNSIVGSGIVSTDANGILTVPGFAVSPEGNRLQIEGPLPP
jgi:pimeloyl-ACP methyl ester carboxylesterase